MKKTTIIIIGMIVVAGAAYFYFMGGKPTDSGSLAVEDNPEVELAASRVFSLLNQIKSLKIDGSLFKSQAYQTLRDYTVLIPPQNVGRANPFAPLPGSVNQTSTTHR